MPIGMPVIDMISDWAATLSFYANGDTEWFKAALSFQITAGGLMGVVLGMYAAGVVGPRVNMFREGGEWDGCLALFTVIPVSTLLGVAGCALPVLCILAVRDQQRTLLEIPLLVLTALELLFEELPQSVLQTYVGAAYGEGADWLPPSARAFVRKARNAQESHEAVRPVEAGRTPAVCCRR